MCQEYLDRHFYQVKNMINQTIADDHEHAFAFSENAVSPVMLGDCDEVDRPTIKDQIGTFHEHTIDYSRPSPDDFKLFMSTPDKYMCYVRPMEGTYLARCYDRDLAICGERELS